jgi:outer membrane lipoprotein-sorting protein
MRIQRFSRLVILEASYGIALAVLFSLASFAETPEEKGLTIAQESERRDSGWGDYETTVTMILRNSRGDESIRELRVRYLELEDDGDKSLVIVDRPDDVKGTALLTHSHRTANDDQWLYLPGLKRVKRISSSIKSGPFMGSEFAFEDMSSPEIEKHTYSYLRDEDLDGLACFVIQRIPVYKQSGYTRQVVWIDRDECRIQKVEFYDRKDALLKTLMVEDYQQYLDRYWRAGKLHMINHQTGKSTEMLWSNTAFRKGFTDRDFDQNSLASVK